MSHHVDFLSKMVKNDDCMTHESRICNEYMSYQGTRGLIQLSTTCQSKDSIMDWCVTRMWIGTCITHENKPFSCTQHINMRNGQNQSERSQTYQIPLSYDGKYFLKIWGLN
jgi:hypothetical protein